MLLHFMRDLALRCEAPPLQGPSPVTLPAWWAPELRGMVKGAFKRDACQHPDFKQRASQPLLDCKPCDPSLRRECSYACCFEPLAESGTGDAPVPFVFESHLPDARIRCGHRSNETPSFVVEEGLLLPFSVLALGHAGESLPALFESMNSAGQQQGLGAPERRVRVSLVPPAPGCHWNYRLDLNSLPSTVPRSSSRLPRVRIKLTAPLRLLSTADGERMLVTTPTASDLVKAALDTISSLARALGEPIYPDRESLLSAAARTVVIDSELTRHSQHVSANHGARMMLFEGLTGWLLLSELPIELQPWLYWAGKLHVGDRRASGAGSWSVELD